VAGAIQTNVVVRPDAPTGPAMIVYLTTGGLFSQESPVVTVAEQ
jgi:hypothetical protein